MVVFTIEERACSPECYLAGCNAAWAGETIDDCPYTHIPEDDDGWERSEWRAGFEEAIYGVPHVVSTARSSKSLCI
jgi:hypothetical protein